MEVCALYNYKFDNFENMFKLIERMTGPEKMPSVVFGVTDKNGTIGVRAFGAHPDGSEVKADGIYAVYSVTKAIVGLAVLQLWEQGKILLDDPVKRYIPEFAGYMKEKMTVWHLMTHTSGIDQSAIFRVFMEKDTSDIDIYDAFMRGGVTYEPGTHKLYNNMTYSVMAELVKRVSGMELEEYLKKNVFDPLGMDDTSFDKHLTAPERVVPVLNYMGGEIVDIPGIFDKRLPAGGLFSTAEDLLKLGRALLNGGTNGNSRILSPLTIDAMRTPQTVNVPHLFPGDNLKDFEIGLSWFIPSAKTHSVIYKNVYGHMGATRCNFWMYPEKGLSFAFMTNCIGPKEENIHFDYWFQILNAFSSCIVE